VSTVDFRWVKLSVTLGLAMVVTKKLRRYADDCLAWALKENDPSRKYFLVTAARSWATTAAAIEERVAETRGDPVDDLKRKLN
jgi:hypothetical protein